MWFLIVPWYFCGIKSFYMKKHLVILPFLFASLASGASGVGDGRYSRQLGDSGWRMMRDTAAQWRNDRLYLPSEAGNLGALPVNPPSGGWQALTPTAGIAVSVPGTVEEYSTTSTQPQPTDKVGVSWWWRKVRVPKDMKGRRVWLRFESARQRAEVYLDGRLVAYDIIGETPFGADITDAVRFGEEQLLAVRITNAGGNFHWQDYQPFWWGKYQMLPGRSFGGIIGGVTLHCTPDVHISDIYMQNLPTATDANALVEMENLTGKACKRDLKVTVCERHNPGKVVFSHVYKKVELPVGVSTQNFRISCPDAKLWDIGKPNLYTCKVEIVGKKSVADNDQRDFGFRWFTADGIGKDAVLRLNGRRVMLKSAISWGYFPVTGLAATDEMAERQIKAAQELGLNMLNFHRCIGRPNVLTKADSLGLLYYEEPGGYQSGRRDSFARAVANEKIQRMIRRDRSHPSLVIYNMINEYGGSGDADTTLVKARMQDMRLAHAVDPSRIITFTSGWALNENSDEVSKSNMRPFDSTLYRRGWFDNHRAGGPSTWEEKYYKGPSDNYMHTNNKTEIYMRGEEGAISTPPRLQLIHDEIQRTGKTGWDGLFWERQYKAFDKFFNDKQLGQGGFASLDSLCCLMGRVQLEHQGRRIQGMRMQNHGDAYVINGWESMPYDNHSGVVDVYRNPKCNPQVLAQYNAPLYVAVCTRNQVVRLPGTAVVDCYVVNEENVRGPHSLKLYAKGPDGQRKLVSDVKVNVEGGEKYGQMLKEGIEVDFAGAPGMYSLEAELVPVSGQPTIVAKGHDEVLAVGWDAAELGGKGAVYGGENDDVARFYNQATGRELPAFTGKTGRLDWLVVNRSSLDEPEPIPADNFRNLRLTWFTDNDIRFKAGEEAAATVNRTFASGAQPASCLPANHTFSATWEGDLVSNETGLHLLGIEGSAGVRLWVNGEQVLDKYWNKQPFAEIRPVQMEAGKPVHIKVGYYQHGEKGSIQMKWSRPGAIQVAPSTILDRAKNDGTTVVVLGQTETWMDVIAKATGITYDGCYTVGQNWVGGIHFVKNHPLFSGLPQATAMDWPYQALVHDGSNRYGFNVAGEELVVGSYRSWPFHLGTAVGIVPYGKGCIVFSSLDVVKNLCNPEGPSEVARRLFCNMINYRKK